MIEQLYDYEVEAERVKTALREVFPLDTIVTSPGYRGRVHLKIVSDQFNGKNEAEKQAYIYEVLNDHLGPEAQVVSLALAYSTDEL